MAKKKIPDLLIALLVFVSIVVLMVFAKIIFKVA